MTEDEVDKLLGIKRDRREQRYPGVSVLNHRWEQENTFVEVGELSENDTHALSGGKLSVKVHIRINKLLLDADTTLIVGPVSPEHGVGFSGGHQHLFPHLGGEDARDFTHWLGALTTSTATIGRRDTEVRQAIELAASRVPGRRLAVCLVTTDKGLHGIFTGEVQQAWQKASELSEEVHIRWCDQPYKRVLSVVPPKFSDLWTAAQAMSKVEPVVADRGEVILFAPHIKEFSALNGEALEKVGYHVRDYFLEQWDDFKDLPWSVLAHSAHLRGDGTFGDGDESARIKVTLASAISAEKCRAMGLGYRDPDTIKVEQWEKDEEVLVVPQAGEILFRLKETELSSVQIGSSSSRLGASS